MSELEHLRCHSSVRRLPRGKVLCRTVELREELKIFLIEKKCNVASKFDDKPWMRKVYYLNDVFIAVNELTSSMQGRNHNIIDIVLSEKLLGFKD